MKDKLFLEVTDRILDPPGDTPKQALWFSLERDFNFNRQNMLENLEGFEDALLKKSIDGGADVLTCRTCSRAFVLH
jgi:hypothetical protein